jgi:hypothetical protein
MKRLSRQRCYVHHEKGARASRPSVAVLRAAGAKVVLAVVGIRWGIGPGVVRKLDGWSRGRFTCSRKRFGTSPCFLRFPLCRLGANRYQIRIRRMGSSRSRGAIAEKAAFFISTFSSSTTAFCSSARLEKSRAEEDSLVAESALARLRAFFAFHFAALVLTGARFASVAWAAAASPCRRVAVSPYRRIAVSPCRRIAVSPHRRIAASPCRRIAVSPCRRVAASPYRRVAVSPCRRIAVTAFVVKCRFPVHCSGVLVGVVVALVVGVVVVVVFVVVLVVGDLGRVGWSHGQVGHTKTSS